MLTFDKKRNLIYIGLAVIIVSACLLAVFLFKGHYSPGVAAEDIPLVRTTTVTSAGTNQDYIYSGEVRGRYESQLAFQVSGRIIKRQVELGSQVRKGQVLMQIDPKDIQQAVNSQSAQVASAQSQLQLAEQNLKRYRTLFEQDVISRSQLDRYQSAYEVALANHQQATALRAQSAYQLGYTQLCADRPGVVSALGAEAGQVVGAGQAVVTLVQDGDREVEISVPENRIEALRNAAPIKISFWALQDVVIGGRIREISPMADPVSRTYKVRVTLLKEPPEVKLGMTASVNVTPPGDQHAATVYIPLSALYQTKETPHVWVVQNGMVHLRPVKTGVFGTDQVQITGGLISGEVIVTAGVHKLLEGLKVKAMTGEGQ